MSATRSAKGILDSDFLTIRCQILNLASALDRIDRGEDRNSIDDDPQLKLLRDGLALLQQPGPGRAEKVQLHFSDQYVPGWNQ